MRHIFSVQVATTLVAVLLGAPFAHGEPAVIVRSIVVSGHAELEVAADQADLTLRVAKTRPTLAAARAAATTVVTQILDLTRELGIPNDDVATSRVEVLPNYGSGFFSGAKIKEYRFERQVRVRVTDLSKLGKLIERSTSLGVTDIDTPRLSVKDEPGVRRQVLAAAVENAIKNADAMAKAAGARLGPVRGIAPRGMLAQRSRGNMNSGTDEIVVTAQRRGAQGVPITIDTVGAVTYIPEEIQLKADIEAEFDLEPVEK